MTFVVDHMGIGFRGLILAAVLAATMSNLSASFNSSASSLMSDWLGRWLPKIDDRKGLRMARLLTVASAIVHAAVAIAVYEIGMRSRSSIPCSASPGSRSGYCLAYTHWDCFSPRVAEYGTRAPFTIGVVVTCYVAFATPLSGYWYTLVGSSVIVISGLIFSAIFDPPVTKAPKL